MRHLRDAEQPGGDGFIPVVGAAVFERLADDGRLEEAQPAAGSGLDLVDGGEQLGGELGVAGLDPPGHPSGTARRAEGGQAQPIPSIAASSARAPGTQAAGISAVPGKGPYAATVQPVRASTSQHAASPPHIRTLRNRRATCSNACRSLPLMTIGPPLGRLPGGSA